MEDVFLASFDATNGNTQWVEIIGNEGDEIVYSLEMDDDGNIYAPLQFSGDSTQIGNQVVVRTNTNEPLATVLCKINPVGLVDWTLLFDGKLNIRNSDFVDNHFYFSTFMNTDTLKIDTLTHINLTTRAGLYGKVSNTGNLQWLTVIDADFWNVFDFGLSTNKEGETLIYGTKDENATFTFNSQNLDSTNNNRFYLNLDDNGNIRWYKSYRITPVNTGYMSGIAWGKNDDFYSLYYGLFFTTFFPLGNFTITDSLRQYAFIPKMLDYSQQTIPLQSGWSMVSSFIDPPNDSLEHVLDSVENHLTILKDPMGSVYWPQFGVNNIGSWDYHDGYQCKMIIMDSLVMLGPRCLSDTTQFNIQNGWNMISYLSLINRSPIDVFAPYINYIIIVKNGQGQVYWPQFGLDNMGLMYPGLGYQLKATQNINFFYPAD